MENIKYDTVMSELKSNRNIRGKMIPQHMTSQVPGLVQDLKGGGNILVLWPL